jgi:hypothetical protein
MDTIAAPQPPAISSKCREARDSAVSLVEQAYELLRRAAQVTSPLSGNDWQKFNQRIASEAERIRDLNIRLAAAPLPLRHDSDSA